MIDSTWSATVALSGSGKGQPISARKAISIAWLIRERSNSTVRPSRFMTVRVTVAMLADSGVPGGGSKPMPARDGGGVLILFSSILDDMCQAGEDDGAHYRGEPSSGAGVLITPTVAPASELQTSWGELEEHPPDKGAGDTPVHLPAKARVVTAPFEARAIGRSSGLETDRFSGSGFLLAVASQLSGEPVHLTAVVSPHRCGAAPVSHRVPSCVADRRMSRRAANRQ
ncbi:hypothetical protein NITHO_3050001 [Nitrolancea hollandica Lb]|uniref:Uncharacterized protein n=1 Tax=Nitrolancea hollandica Lb TaxID=1129897 RepID=I4EH94_9BACT|nr:hypothetical protein NITHO_3050001 [Nitrolancea hollandica Lb]